MPAIWNVNNSYGAGNKKISSKLTFEIGEKFAGRISGDAEDGGVFVKLTDGWEFPAELQESDIQGNPGLMQFQVAGYDGGKIKLEILKKSLDQSDDIDDNLKQFATKEGLEGEDISLLKSMIEHDIPLTGENITFVKSLIDFNKKINKDSEEIDKFISKYLQSKGIDENSEQGSNIRNTLNNFLSKYQGMSKEDILLFLENNIDINEENIDSFNKLFKGNQTIKDILDNISSSLKDINGDDVLESKDILQNNQTIENQKDEEVQATNQNSSAKNIASKLYEANGSIRSKLSVIGILKSIAGNDSNILKGPLRDILNARSSSITSSDFKSINSKIEITSDQEFLNNILSQNKGENIELSKESIQKAVSNLFQRDVEISNQESAKIKDFIYAKLGMAEKAQTNDDSEGNNQKINIDFNRFKDNIKDIFDGRKNSLRGVIRENAMNNISNLDDNKISDMIKQSLGKDNLISKENYDKLFTDLFGKNVNILKDEVDSLNDCIKINTNQNSNIKNDSESTINKNNTYSKYSDALKNSNDIKSFLKDSFKNLSNDFSKKDINDVLKSMDNIPKEKLTNIIKEEMIKSNVDIDKRVFARILEDKTLILKQSSEVIKNIKTPGEAIQNDLRLKINDMKDVVKEIIQKTGNENTLSSKIMQFIESNINDFKMFNSFSNEYYYLDMPVAANSRDYPCKLIIKDKRRDNKKIDKTSIKMVVAVKTANLGKIDGFLYVRSNRLDVNLKCEKEYMRLFSIAKDSLKDKLDSIGFTSDVTVSEKKQDVNLATCREFFNTDNSRRIDTMV